MKEQICDINQLYKGLNADFNEVDYLSNVAKLRHELRNSIVKKDLVHLSQEGVHYSIAGNEYREPNCFPDQTNRIEKNGSITVEFYRGAPYKIGTPFGELQIHDSDHVSFGSAFDSVNQTRAQNYFQKLVKDYGLIQVGVKKDNGENCPVYAVTRLPWLEKKNSILPWKRKQNYATEHKLPMPSQSYQTYRPSSDEDIDYDLARDPEYYENYYKDKQYFAPEFAREKVHIQKVFDVVNAQLIQDRHPEYIMPKTDSRPKIAGVHYDMKYYLKKFPEALAQFKAALQEDNAQNAKMAEALKQTSHPESNYGSNVVKYSTNIIQQNITSDREM